MKKKVCLFICIMAISLIGNVNVFARTDFQPGWPLRNGYNISALDVYQSGSAHRGIDIGHGNQPTQAVYAIADGVVSEVVNSCSHYNVYPHSSVSCSADSLGNYVTIKHAVNGNVFYSQYAHLTKNSITVKVGDSVTLNTQIGNMGSSGNSTGPHLHLAIWESGYYSDRVRTFDFYKDNSYLMKTIRIRQKLANVSPIYGQWIKKNGTLKDELYYFECWSNDQEPSPKCASHSYNKSGYCKNCGAEYSMSLSSMNTTYKTKKDGVPVRNRPYATDTTISTLSKGKKVTVVASGKNSEGNLWYKTSDATWIYSGNLEKVPSSEVSTLAINMTSYPSSIKQGSSYGLRGSVTSNYNITSVKAYVINSYNSTVLSTSDTPNSKSMDVKTANLNDKMTFNSLPTGTYTMKVVATDLSGKSKEWSTTFNVASTATVTTKTGTVNIPSSWTDLSIRSGPSTNHQIVGGMPNGARCTVYPDKASNGWYYVEYNGVYGYASGNCIKLQ